MSELDNSNMIHRLTCQDKEITLVGTAHVSSQSVQLVEDVITAEQPQTVCVELCESRFQSIRQQDHWQNMDIIKVIKEKKSMLLLSNLMLASLQKRIAKKFDIKPGQEMLQAIDCADTVGAHIELVDRDIRTTLSRTWRMMGLWSKVKLMFQLLLSLGEVEDIKAEDVEKMKQEDILESLLADVGKSLPVLRDILIDERDQYLASKIKNAPGNKIVAVVGAGHVPGIKKYWDQQIDIATLETLPPASRWVSVFKWVIPLAIISLVIAGFFYGGTQTGTDMIKGWVLVNGILAGLGAIMALAHPLTIVSSILAAPLTSLNPMIAAGWVSGLVEAFSRKPRVKDFQMLQEDIHSMRGFWRNKVTRVLLVVVFTNLGSSLGTFVAIPLMVKIL